MQILPGTGSHGLRPAPVPHRATLGVTPMIRIHIKDGQISSRRPYVTPQQQQDQACSSKPGSGAAAAGQRRRVIASSTAGGAAFNSDASAAKSNYWDCTTALTKAIIGAGQLSNRCGS
jgi:hypothetical protein